MTYECRENDNLIAIRDGRESGDGIELLFGHESGVGGWIVIALPDLQAAFEKAGISPLLTETGIHVRHGRKKPYTLAGIGRMPCFRCGKPSSFQWSVCADDNIQRPLCAACDVELNDHVLQWAGDPAAKPKLDAYVARILSSEPR